MEETVATPVEETTDFDIDVMIDEITQNTEAELAINTVEGEASEAKSKSGS